MLRSPEVDGRDGSALLCSLCIAAITIMSLCMILAVVVTGEGGVALGQPVVHPGGLVTLGLCLGAYRACSCLPSAVSEEPLALSVSSALRLSALLVEESGVVQRLLEGVKRRWPESRFYGDLLVHPAPGTVRLRERMADLDAALLGVGGDRGTPSGAEGRTVASASLLSKAAEALFSLPSFQNRQVEWIVGTSLGISPHQTSLLRPHREDPRRTPFCTTGMPCRELPRPCRPRFLPRRCTALQPRPHLCLICFITSCR